MKTLIALLILLVAACAFAKTDTYECTSQSRNGIIRVLETEEGSILLEMAQHEVVFLELAHQIFNRIVRNPSENFANFLLKINQDLYKPGPGVKFTNTSNKLFLNSEVNGNVETCKIDFKLNKNSLLAELEYSCSTLRRKSTSMDDSLRCILHSAE
jgi:hypothetical protein